MANPRAIYIHANEGDRLILGDSIADGVREFVFSFEGGNVFGTENQIEIRTVARQAIRTNPLTIAFDSSSLQYRGPDRSAVVLEAALNSLDDIIDAGLVEVAEVIPNVYEVTFKSNGARSTISVSDDLIGDLSRVTTVRAGDGSTREVQRIDFRFDRVAQIDNADISTMTAGTAAIAVTCNGDANTAQVETLTLSGAMPRAGSIGFSDNGTRYEFATVPLTAYKIQKALDALADDTWSVAEHHHGREFTIARNDAGNSSDLSIDDDGLAFVTGKTAEIDFDAIRRTIERFHVAPMSQAMGREMSHPANFERVPILISFISGDDVSDRTAARRTLLEIEIELVIRGSSVAELSTIL